MVTDLLELRKLNATWAVRKAKTPPPPTSSPGAGGSRLHVSHAAHRRVGFVRSRKQLPVTPQLNIRVPARQQFHPWVDTNRNANPGLTKD